MKTKTVGHKASEILAHLHHYLPTQNPLKDFIHHNTLHAFQEQKFHAGVRQAAHLFGYQVYLTLGEYRRLYQEGKIKPAVFSAVLDQHKGRTYAEAWEVKMLHQAYDEALVGRVGTLRARWKKVYHINLDKAVHPILFRLVGGFLDQGIAIDKFPNHHLPFLEAVLRTDQDSFIKLFGSRRVYQLIEHQQTDLAHLLKLVVGDERYYEHYLFDQQFAHPGWSGMAAVLEANPGSLYDPRRIALEDLVRLELLLEIDALDQKYGDIWKPLAESIEEPIAPYFTKLPPSEYYEVLALWQEMFEWSYYDEVLAGLQLANFGAVAEAQELPSFQAICCIDDRECSFRRYLERNDPRCETFGTAGFFGVAFYFQPEHGKFFTKSCPAPQNPGYVIKESEASKRQTPDTHFSHRTHGVLGGMLHATTFGFWSGLKMAWNILFPSESPAMVSSFSHIDPKGKLSIVHAGEHEDERQVGFTEAEMADRVEGLLKGIGLVENFAPLVYVVGHGASSINNTHFAGYDCGACCGRAGSANARVMAYMANHPAVRALLAERGLVIPPDTHFVSCLHDTTRDEIAYFDQDELSPAQLAQHQIHCRVFAQSLEENAKERSRRFLLINSKDRADRVHAKVKLRSLSLFEPRPEWNHATNSLCLVGQRAHNKHLFLDRRAFLNSYDYRVDPTGNILLGILNAIAPVCGGINLEYYFSRVDTHRLGAGTKLPHNVMGLIGVANGMEGDLRTGLPRQMTNIHDPLRLLVVVEHFPDEVLRVMQLNPATYQWFANEWIHLVAMRPTDGAPFVFRHGEFHPYKSQAKQVKKAQNFEQIFETEAGNLPVYQID
jgi:uncharacterized protein YbcC (UPF0753/DUF2309 family)